MSNHQDSPGKGTIILTGANGSLGSTMAAQIASTPELAAHHGIYAVRDAASAPALRSALAKGQGKAASRPHAHDIISLNLADLSSVRAVAAAINSRVAAGEIPPVRALVLNAGYLEFTSQSWTAAAAEGAEGGGFDMTFASNYLGHWLLTALLLGSMDPAGARVVVVGSESHDPHNSKSKSSFGAPRWMEFMPGGSSEAVARGTWSTSEEDPTFNAGFRRYGASKFCQAMMIPELQRRLDTDPALSGICVLGVDPGSMPTNLTRRGPWFIHLLVFKLVMPLLAPLMAWLRPNGPVRTLELGAADVLAGAFKWSPPPKGGYFYGSRPEKMTPEVQDVKKRERLWVETVGYAGLKEGETSLQNWK